MTKGYTKQGGDKKADDERPHEKAAINDMQARGKASTRRHPLPNRPPMTAGNVRVPLKRRM